MAWKRRLVLKCALWAKKKNRFELKKKNNIFGDLLE
jgi:hypothetical protein